MLLDAPRSEWTDRHLGRVREQAAGKSVHLSRSEAPARQGGSDLDAEDRRNDD